MLSVWLSNLKLQKNWQNYNSGRLLKPAGVQLALFVSSKRIFLKILIGPILTKKVATKSSTMKN